MKIKLRGEGGRGSYNLATVEIMFRFPLMEALHLHSTEKKSPYVHMDKREEVGDRRGK